MKIAFEDVRNGDITAFSKVYGDICDKIYHVAFFSLATEKEALETVKEAVRYSYENASSCKNADELKVLMLKKTCEYIVARFREYRKSTPSYDPFQTYIKEQMTRLTDAERLSVAVWAVYGYEVEEISYITGLALDVVAKKLKSGQEKLSAKL